MLAAVGGGLWHRRARLTLVGDGIFTIARDSSGAGQLNARVLYTPWPWLRGDLDLSRLDAGGRTTVQMAAIRTAIVAGPLQLDVQLGQSGAERQGVPFFGNTVTGGASVSRGALTVRATAQRAHSNDYLLMEAAGFTLTRPAGAYALDDVGADLLWQAPRWSLSVGQRWRTSRGATRGTAQGAALAAAVVVAPQLTITLQGGTQLADLLRGVPQARYAGLGVRFTPARRVRALSAAPPVRAGGEVTLERQPGGGTVMLTIEAPPDAVVEMATSATDWTPVRLTREGARFVGRVALPAGVHRVAVRRDGGAWRAPMGLAAVADDFGGSVGILVVP